MELKILEKSDDEMKMEIAGESHTLLNMLKIILLEDERVHTASYDMKHVTISEPVLFIKTENADPIDVVKAAVAKLITECEEFVTVFNKAVE
ncbi:DNA-directed RNA polymerase subunit L [Methanococcoides burtonii]|uniref:DNA-directed RNA polymerase subunit Rpo11 n=1 Tax=Methanococcoides burtonii (strain DSM 6242 / NBRC 107633 / OCM 468 / ACE-M) TaxID=259564 RepID=RPO11_METBU|nr:DNA-directed RNA polymerase subunit L [Methanococcoides burtonii]Q12W27.1 RecName: Full=DNA-directed RNA polymerase subunit Rpo11; AltName: Full=DNA-directed RNA polymerase subunit L [Methanococcoides burtonii DSM 6242]ABE52349.1 DNA-directed RNA polymerase subunit L [Methanococcoides burtonii DSM 6242]